MLELRVGPRREGGTLTTGTITEPVPPVPLAPERTPFDVIIERFDAIDKRLDQQGTAIVKLAEMQVGHQQGQRPQHLRTGLPFPESYQFV